MVCLYGRRLREATMRSRCKRGFAWKFREQGQSGLWGWGGSPVLWGEELTLLVKESCGPLASDCLALGAALVHVSGQD